jgi:nitrite reductase/ring-hydroxylating ferredoxin subunit/DMSO/TMAO reductase YedYZ heme-binding membrane subunit
MSHTYKPVIWNRTKLIYDAVLLVGVAAYLLAFLKLAPLLSSETAAVTYPIYLMRAFGTCAFLLLTIVLAIGPLARLDTRFLPLLYNRRHFGVVTALVAVSHAISVLNWYFAFSPIPPLDGLFGANTSYGRIIGFPFESLGVFALLILVVMAVTSHDFWLSFLTPPVWKWLHMSVYAAYAAIVLHVALGPLAGGGNPVLALTVGASLALLITLHTFAGRREARADTLRDLPAPDDGWIDVGDVRDIAEGRALIGAGQGGERIAVFRFKGRLSAMSNVCSHQNGPIGEGKVVLGFVTCPWHGYQYRLEDGCSPPPYKERLRKYRVRLTGTRVQVDPAALPLGTVVEPVVIPDMMAGAA